MDSSGNVNDVIFNNLDNFNLIPDNLPTRINSISITEDLGEPKRSINFNSIKEIQLGTNSVAA